MLGVFYMLTNFPHKNVSIFIFNPFVFKIFYLLHHRNNPVRVKYQAKKRKQKMYPSKFVKSTWNYSVH